MKYSYVKYYLMRWDMIQDGWIKVEVLSIVIEWSLVDNLVTSENKGKRAKISKKNKLKKSHNLRHTNQYLILVKKCLRFHDSIFEGVTYIVLEKLHHDKRQSNSSYKITYSIHTLFYKVICHMISLIQNITKK